MVLFNSLFSWSAVIITYETSYDIKLRQKFHYYESRLWIDVVTICRVTNWRSCELSLLRTDVVMNCRFHFVMNGRVMNSHNTNHWRTSILGFGVGSLWWTGGWDGLFPISAVHNRELMDPQNVGELLNKLLNFRRRKKSAIFERPLLSNREVSDHMPIGKSS